MPPENRTLTLSGTQKLIALILTILTAVTSATTSVAIFKTSTNYQLEDHDRRITKLESRADNNDKSVNEITAKLDTVIAILQRVEREQQKGTPNH
jgi:hypothetical protein